jgi:mannose-1-phosphate guanylyltransferase
MKAVILAGGQGTRLRPLTINTPKAMVPIANMPFLECFLVYLRSHGVDEAILALGHLPKAVAEYFGDGRRLGIRITPSIEESPLGTAGAVANAARFLDGPFLVFNGDVFTDIDLTEMISWHRNHRSVATLALTKVENPSAYGVLDVTTDGRIRHFVEKPPAGQEPSNLINAGVYLLEREVLEWIPAGRFAMFERDVFPKMLAADKELYGYRSDAYWIDIGTPASYLAVNQDVVSGKVSPGWLKLEERLEDDPLISGLVLGGQVVIGQGTILGKGAAITGASVIGRHCVIGPSAKMEGVVVWDGVKIGEGAVLKNCIIARDACLGTRCYVPDGCVVGERVTIRDGQVLEPDTRVSTEVDGNSPV